MKRFTSQSRAEREQQARIRDLRKRLMLPAATEPSNPAAEESLLRYLVAIENGPTTTGARQLIADGIELPPPDTLRPGEVHAKLWEVLRGLAHRRTYLEHTDHLSDLELYRYLWEVTLNEETEDFDDAMGQCSCHVDLVGSGSQESEHLRMQYYADDLDRDLWREFYPDEDPPDPIDPPHDRDRLLPRP